MRSTRMVCLGIVGLLLFLSVPSADAQNVQVSSADPPSGEQGTVNLNVILKGKGFKHGAQAQWFVSGSTNPGGVTVNSTAFVSDTELLANVTIADDAVISAYDIVVTNSNGRSGKGTELFRVTQKGSGGGTGANDHPLEIGIRDDSLSTPADQLYSDCGIGFDSLGNHFCPYRDGENLVGARFLDNSDNGNGRLSFFLTKSPKAVRYVRLVFSSPSVCFDANCEAWDSPFDGQIDWQVRFLFTLTGVPSFDAIAVGGSAQAMGGIFLDDVKLNDMERNVNYILRFKPDFATPDGFNCASSTPIIVNRVAQNEWHLEASPQNLACIERQETKRGTVTRTHRGYLSLPFRLVMRKLP